MSGAAPRPAAVALEGIAKKFGAFVALRDVTLAIEPGELVCFLGPSGCGKTTLLADHRRPRAPERGASSAWRAATCRRLPPAPRNYGIVFQSYALFPNLSVARNVAYGLERRRAARAEIDGRVDELLALVGLGHHKHKYPAQLSGGEQQRVALARALAPKPALLLLDEPLSALDARVRQSLRLEIRRLQRRLGVTTIMVTHDQEEALAMADRIVVMNHGVVEQVGSPISVYTRAGLAVRGALRGADELHRGDGGRARGLGARGAGGGVLPRRAKALARGDAGDARHPARGDPGRARRAREPEPAA